MTGYLTEKFYRFITNSQKKRSNNSQGFTLVELAIVMIILGLLTIAGLQLYKIYMNAKIRAELEQTMRNAQDALNDFTLDNKCNAPPDDELSTWIGDPDARITPYAVQWWCQEKEPQTINEQTKWLRDCSYNGAIKEVICSEGDYAWQVAEGPDSDFTADPTRFPCPAPFLSIDDPNFGQEAFDSGASNPSYGAGFGDCNSGVISVGSGDDTVYIGTLPTATLGLGARSAIDPYGNLLTYAVSKSVVAVGALDGGIREEGAIKITDGLDALTGGVSNITEKARFALVSHGRSGNGAYSARGVRRSCADDSIPADMSNANREDSINCIKTQEDRNRAEFQSSPRWASGETKYDGYVISQLAYGVDGWLRQTDTESSHLAAKNVGNVGFGTTPVNDARLHVDGNYLNDEGSIVITGTANASGDGTPLNAYSYLILSDDRQDPKNSGWSFVYEGVNQDLQVWSKHKDDDVTVQAVPRLTLSYSPNDGDMGINTNDPQATLHVNASYYQEDTDTPRTGSLLITGHGADDEYSKIILGRNVDGDTDEYDDTQSWQIIYKDENAPAPEASDMQITAVDDTGAIIFEPTDSKEVALAFDSEHGFTGLGTKNPNDDLHVYNNIENAGITVTGQSTEVDGDDLYSSVLLAQGQDLATETGWAMEYSEYSDFSPALLFSRYEDGNRKPHVVFEADEDGNSYVTIGNHDNHNSNIPKANLEIVNNRDNEGGANIRVDSYNIDRDNVGLRYAHQGMDHWSAHLHKNEEGNDVPFYGISYFEDGEYGNTVVRLTKSNRVGIGGSNGGVDPDLNPSPATLHIKNDGEGPELRLDTTSNLTSAIRFAKEGIDYWAIAASNDLNGDFRIGRIQDNLLGMGTDDNAITIKSSDLFVGVGPTVTNPQYRLHVGDSGSRDGHIKADNDILAENYFYSDIPEEDGNGNGGGANPPGVSDITCSSGQAVTGISNGVPQCGVIAGGGGANCSPCPQGFYFSGCNVDGTSVCYPVDGGECELRRYYGYSPDDACDGTGPLGTCRSGQYCVNRGDLVVEFDASEHSTGDTYAVLCCRQ